MKNIFTLVFISTAGLFLVLGCSNSSDSNKPAVKTESAAPEVSAQTTPEDQPPIKITAKNLTKEYEENELAADGKYKDKQLAVSGKVSNIAETFGNVTVSLEGFNGVVSVMCSFEESEKENVAKLKKGQNVILKGKGDGSTGGLYVGLEACKIG